MGSSAPSGRLRKLLENKKREIVDRWVKAIHNSYPAQTAEFLKKEPNKFANPLGSTIQETVFPLFDQLCGDRNPVELKRLLDNLVRIRSVQEFSPASAVQVIFFLKDAVRQELLKDIEKSGLWRDYLDFESEIDRFASLAFDVYMECRERIWRIKMDDLMKRPEMLTGGMCFSYMVRRGNKHLERLEKRKTQH